MRRIALGLIVCSAISAVAAPAVAGDTWHTFWAGVKRDFHRNNCWPDPFVYPDRAGVIQPFAVQVQNGWRLQNLMADHHFDENSQQLTMAGKEKVRWILTQAPERFRTVFVQRGVNPDQTATRVDSVQQFAVNILPAGELPAIEETNQAPRGWPADEINDTFVKYRTTARPPQLPDSTGEDN